MASINNNLTTSGAVLTGTASDDYFADANGNTIITTMIGSLGNDYYVIDGSTLANADIAVEYNGKIEGIDTVAIYTTGLAGYTLANSVEVLIIGASATAGTYSGNLDDNSINASAHTGALTLNGGSGADTLLSGSGADTLDGGSGIDSMAGGTGNDVYWIDIATDKITEAAGAGTDSVRAKVSYTLATDVENLYLQSTYAQALTAIGNALNNTISGNEFNNILNGLDGDDTINATSTANGSATGGNDTIDGGNGNDTLTAGAGDDRLIGGAGNDSLTSGNGNNFLDGGADNDALTAGSGNDSLLGGLGNDTLDGGAGNDTLDGGDGNDYLKDTGSSGNGVLKGGNGNDLLVAYGTPGSSFDGGGGDDILVLLGANGSDAGFTATTVMQGGAGNDTFYVQAAPSATKIVVADAGGNDTVRLVGTVTGTRLIMGPDWFQGAADNQQGTNVGLVSPGTELTTYFLGTGIENLFADLAGSPKYLVGNDLDNLIRGTDSATGDVLLGGKGNDTLDGGSGADNMLGGVGNDRYLVNDANDTVFEDIAATGGIDTVLAWTNHRLEAGVENLTFFGTAALNGGGNDANNIIIGNDGANTLDGGKGNDDIQGGLGADILYGGAGADTLNGGGGTDKLFGGDGNDTYWVDAVTDTVQDINDIATGTSATDLVRSTSASFALRNGSQVENLSLEQLAGVTTGQGNDLANLIKGNTLDNLLSDGSYDLISVAGWSDDGKKDTLDGGAGNDTYFTAIGSGSVDTLIDVAGSGDTLVLWVANAANSGLKVDAATKLAQVTLGAQNSGTTSGLNLVAIENLDLGSYSQVHVTTGAFVGFNVIGSAAANILYGSNLDDVIDGGGGNDTISGDLGANTLKGGAGNDYLDGSIATSANTLHGGLGDDIYWFGDNTANSIAATGETGGIDKIVATDQSIDLTSTVHGGTPATGAETGTIEKVSITIAATTANVAVTGNTSNNELQLSAHAGTASVVTLTGGKGDDIYLIGDSGQANTTAFALNKVTIVENASEGIDKVISYINNYVLQNNVENLDLGTVNNGSVFVANGSGNNLVNVIKGNDGNNQLDGVLNVTGADTLIGGKGNDVYIVHSTADIVTENINEGTDTMVFGSSSGGNMTLATNIETGYLWDYPAGVATYTGTTLIGNILDNTLYGNQLANSLDGGVGNDVLYGSISNINGTQGEDNAADTLIGGAGDDTFHVYNGDTVTELGLGGSDLVYLKGNNPSYTLQAEVESLTVQNTAVNNVAGNAIANIINSSGGNATSQTIDGKAGNDTITGAGGADTIYGGTGADLMMGGAGNDTYYVGNGGDIVGDTGGTDKIIVDRNSTVSLDTESTTLGIFSLASNGWGVENLDYQNTSSVASALTTPVWLEGNELANIIQFNDANGRAYIQGGGGNDTLTILSSSGANTLDGGAGNDSLTGGGGADTLIGAMGNDTLSGGGGNDIFTFDSPDAVAGIDVVADFVSGSDKLQLASSVFTSLIEPLGAGNICSGAGVTVAADADDFLIYNTTTGSLYYDADGVGSAYSAVQFATISGAPVLTEADFSVI